MIQIHPSLKTFVKPDAHSKFSPSSAERWWGGCAYSLQASEGIVEEESGYATEGTLAHSVSEAVFRLREYGMSIPAALSLEMAQQRDSGEEMLNAGHDFYEVCKFWLHNKNVIGDIVWFGQEGPIPIYPEHSCYGTADFMIVGTRGAVVIDYKFGRKPVKPDCKQLRAYAAGIARHLTNLPVNENGVVHYGIHTVIHQPRLSNPVSEHCYPVQELWEALTDIKKWILTANHEKDLQPIEGSHCFWCPARRTKDINKRCKLILEKPLKLANENFDKFLADANITPDTVVNKVARDEALVKLMTLFPAIEEIVKQGEDDFLRRFEAGESVPNLQLVREYGNRKLNAENDKEAAAMIKDMFPDVNPYRVVTKTSIRPIGDLEKEVGKNMLDPICTKKVTRKVKVLDEKAQSILNSMSNYARNISNS